MSYLVADDTELAKSITMKDVIRKIEDALRARAGGSLVALSRVHVPVEKGSMAITAGAESEHDHVVGFYATFWAMTESRHSDYVRKVGVVFDSQTGALKGVILGASIMEARTGGIGGVAIKYMSRPDSKVVGLIGSGLQARLQLEAAAAVRQIEQVKVYSRAAGHRDAFATEMGEKLGLRIEPVFRVEDAIQGVDILISATSSGTPVFEARWLSPGMHVTTLGPKQTDRHEFPTEAAEMAAVIATDSLAEVDSREQNRSHFLASTPHRARMIELSDIVTGKALGRTSPEDITLFCSVGLAGTEVMVANEALRLAQQAPAREGGHG